MKAFVKKCLDAHGLCYCILFGLVTALFIALKVTMPILYTGSYIDEYLHIMAGSEFFSEGRMTGFYSSGPYYRGAHMSLWVGLWVTLFGKSIFVAKMAAVSVGIVNFFLVFYIAGRVISDKKYVLLLLVVYAASPWVLFNHFYVRMYVIYELFLLLLLVLGHKIILATREKSWRPFLFYLGFLLALNGINLYWSNDKGMYIVALATVLLVFYVYIFEMGEMRISSQKAGPRLANALFVLHPAIKVIVVVALVAFFGWLLNIQDKVDFLLEGKLKYTSRDDFKYNSFFGARNAVFTMFFGLSVVTVFFLKFSYQRLVTVVGGALFVLHLFSSQDLQITRGLLYFVPVFLIVGFVGVSQISYVSDRLLFVLFVLMFADATSLAYPRDFLSHPHIPTEIYYVDYKKLYGAVKAKCGDAVVIDASPSEYIAEFYGVKIDRILSSAGEARKNRMYSCYKRGTMCITTRDGTPVIQKTEELAAFEQDICLIVRQPSRFAYIHDRFDRFLERQRPLAAFENISLYRFEPAAVQAYSDGQAAETME